MHVYLRVDGGAEDVAVGKVDGFAGALLEGGFAFGEVENHWGCCDGQDEEGESEDGELHFI